MAKNLEQHIRDSFIKLNDREKLYESHNLHSEILTNHLEKERDSLRRLQFLLYLTMKEQYPNETIDGTTMFEKYIFEIKVTLK
jgi:hypothetical protein